MKAINLKFGAEKPLSNDGLQHTALRVQVEKALKDVNGRAEGHTYTTIHDINDLVKDAESRLNALDLPKPQRVGAFFYSTSGADVPSAYKYSRAATRVGLERRASGWFLVSISADTIYKEGGKNNLMLTKAQAEEAVKRFTDRSFWVAKD